MLINQLTSLTQFECVTANGLIHSNSIQFEQFIDSFHPGDPRGRYPLSFQPIQCILNVIRSIQFINS